MPRHFAVDPGQDVIEEFDDRHLRAKASPHRAEFHADDAGADDEELLRDLAEFERDFVRDQVESGLAAARARGVKLGRKHGQRPSDKKARRVLTMHKEGRSYRLVGRNIGLSKNTVMEIVKREVVQPA